MRRVMNSRDVMHRWANATQSSARNASGSVSFDSENLYSYQARIARRMRVNGEPVVLLSADTWTRTTAKHQSWAWSAASHLPCFHVASMGQGVWESIDHAANLERYSGVISDQIGKASRARVQGNKAMWERATLTTMREANLYATCFGLPLPYDESDMAATLDRLKIIMAERDKLAAERKAARAAEQRAAMAQHAAEWIAGTRPSLHYDYPDTLLRLSSWNDGQWVQTSKGATMPLADARRLYDAIIAREARRGDSIGGYVIRDVTSKLLTIGCHQITRAEIDRFAASMGWGPANGSVAAQMRIDGYDVANPKTPRGWDHVET